MEFLAKQNAPPQPWDKPREFHFPPLRLTEYFADPLNNLTRLRSQLEAKGRTAVLAAATVQGMGGVGKTQLALRYSHEYCLKYAGVWWLRAETTTLLEEDCHLFCKRLEIPVVQGERPHGAMKDWLGKQPCWLLVYDNAVEAKDLQDYLPNVGAHHVLITSRGHGWPRESTLSLDVWHGDDALPFLRQRLPRVCNDDALRQLSKALDGLPLALEQACAYLEFRHVAITDYILWIDQQNRGPKILNREDSSCCPRSVTATLSLAFGNLSKPAKELLQLCAWLAPEPIPEYLFTEHVDELPQSLQAAAKDEFDWSNTVAELEHHGLCHVLEREMADHAGNHGELGVCLVFHRLTQSAIRAVALQSVAEAVLALLYAAFPDGADSPAQWPRCRALMPHVQRLDAYYSKDWVAQQSYVWLMNELATYMIFGPILLHEAESLSRRALACSEMALGAEHLETLTAMDNIAAALYGRGHSSSALELEEKVFSIRASVLGIEHRSTLATMGNLGTMRAAKGDLSGACTVQEMAMDTFCRALGDEHPDALCAMNSFAATLRLKGDLARARELFEKTLGIRRLVLGDEHVDTVKSMNSLAATVWQQGDLPYASALLEKGLDIACRVLGDEHPLTLFIMGNVAVARRDQADLPGARALQEKVLNAYKRVLGEEHPSTIRTMGFLATVIQLQDDIPSARLLLENALDISCRILGAEHPDTFNIMTRLATVYWQQGEYKEAQALLEDALAGNRRILKDEAHPNIIIVTKYLNDMHNGYDLAVGAHFKLLVFSLNFAPLHSGNQHEKEKREQSMTAPATRNPQRETPKASKTAVEVFISYSHKDEALKNELITHLSLLRRQGEVSLWNDRAIVGGDEWQNQIDVHLESAGLILLLISADFVASDYCWDVEIQRALARHEAKTARVVPIILRETDLRGAPFMKLQALPRNAAPVTNTQAWASRDEAWANVVKGLRTVIADLANQH